MNPTQKATLMVVLTAFGAGCIDALTPLLSNGVPPQDKWGHILGVVLFAGFLSAWHRFTDSPSQADTTKGYSYLEAMFVTAAITICLGSAAVVSAGCLGAGAIATWAPVVENALCNLAADQTSAEPGWEVYLCDLFDAKGNPVAKVSVHTPKGTPPKTTLPAGMKR